MPGARHRHTEGVHSGLFVHHRFVAVGEDRPRGADGRHRAALGDNPCADRAGCVIPSPADDNGLFRKAEESGDVLGQLTGHVGGFVHLAQLRFLDFHRGEEFRRPAAVAHVQQLHRGGVGHFCRVFAGQAVAQVILRQQNVRRLGPDFRFVFFDPLDLRRGQARAHRVAVDAHHRVVADELSDRFRRFRRSRVVPENGPAQRLALAVQKDRAHHLPGDADGGDVFAGHPRNVEAVADRRDPRFVPVVRILLGPAVVRLIDGIFHAALCHFFAILVKQHRFDAACAQIQSQYVFHLCISLFVLGGLCLSG